jgi:DNA-binding GntR family transcriptional regulator
MQQLIPTHDENKISPAISLQQRVYEKLRSSLIGGTFAPGELLSLRRIAATHGVSPMPVREAVKRLISEGAIELLPNRTTIVPKLRRRDFIELIRVREMLEGEAAKLAVSAMSPKFVLKLAQTNFQLLQAVADGDMARAVRLNEEFHFELYRASNSPVIIPLIESLWVRMGPIIHVAQGRPEVTWNASQHHAALLALEQRDADGARRAIEADIRDVGRELLSLDIFAPG